MSTSNEIWNPPPPTGFRGLRDDVPLTKYDGLLSHWRQSGATDFVTFRLADSLPQARLQQLKSLRRDMRDRDSRTNSRIRNSNQCSMSRPIRAWRD
jgi:hypothetical protein